MAAPVAGAPVNQVAQVAQQAQRPEAAPKTGASKFDQAMVDKAQSADAVNQVNAVQKAQAVEQAQKVGQIQKASSIHASAKTTAVRKDDPVTASSKADKPRSSIETALGQIESRTSAMDRFISDAVGGKVKLSPQQLLGLQAKVSEYSLELDLTGKVVEKATSGLKDTLHTQV
jgi:hypothetical protein